MHLLTSVARPARSLSCSSPGTTLSPDLRTTYPQVLMVNFWFFAMGSLYNSRPDLCTGTTQFYNFVLFSQLLDCLRLLEQFCKNMNPPPALVSVWQGRWRITLWTKSITVCHLFQFPLIWRNMWQTDDMWHFCTIIAQ
jgi:hypothetical protein